MPEKGHKNLVIKQSKKRYKKWFHIEFTNAIKALPYVTKTQIAEKRLERPEMDADPQLSSESLKSLLKAKKAKEENSLKLKK